MKDCNFYWCEVFIVKPDAKKEQTILNVNIHSQYNKNLRNFKP